MLFLHFHIQLFEVRKCRRGYKHQQERNRRVCVDDGLRSRSQRGTQICSIFRHDLLLIKTRGEASEMRNADWLGFVCSAKMVSQASRTNFKMQQNVLSSNLKQILITYFAYTWRQPAVQCDVEQKINFWQEQCRGRIFYVASVLHKAKQLLNASASNHSCVIVLVTRLKRARRKQCKVTIFWCAQRAQEIAFFTTNPSRKKCNNKKWISSRQVNAFISLFVACIKIYGMPHCAPE